ncbi:hypothetical protein AJ80_06259 [Polytolypa hystricis UAMH7299]|uniref:Aminoglycoside phosphotransferase domain-containing protein n=1 Tax=Polytolypa hystricis (strain UAMH7299) TaxID=1447883 RepID=A0A2B7XYS9_POLH7|nr:hypothetical protein AJ80_06259 [Polytolypa hystricis UAMH7299]
MWFGNEFRDLKVHFGGKHPSTWILKEKISEHADSYGEEESEAVEAMSEARAVFLCSKCDNKNTEVAVVKVYMQIPWTGTELDTAERRRAQAYPGRSEVAQDEIYALAQLTAAGCSSTPKLLEEKHIKQWDTLPVPGGSLAFILMEKLPGQRVERIADLALPEREAMRASFKKGWNECYAAGIVPADSGIRNLLWDRKQKKCYIVDFGHWYDSSMYSGWRDGRFEMWDLMVFLSNGEWGP